LPLELKNQGHKKILNKKITSMYTLSYLSLYPQDLRHSRWLNDCVLSDYCSQLSLLYYSSSYGFLSQFLSHWTLLGFCQLFHLGEGVQGRKGGGLNILPGLDWLHLSTTVFQLQSTLYVMTDTETCLQQPTGPPPVLCKYQPEAALVFCQARGGKNKSRRFFALTWGSSWLRSCFSSRYQLMKSS
jgi:hypothetical protein